MPCGAATLRNATQRIRCDCKRTFSHHRLPVHSPTFSHPSTKRLFLYTYMCGSGERFISSLSRVYSESKAAETNSGAFSIIKRYLWQNYWNLRLNCRTQILLIRSQIPPTRCWMLDPKMETAGLRPDKGDPAEFYSLTSLFSSYIFILKLLSVRLSDSKYSPWSTETSHFLFRTITLMCFLANFTLFEPMKT